MVRNYKKVEVEALNFFKAFKHVKNHGKPISTIELARALEVERDDPAFLKTLAFLVKNRRVMESLGIFEGTICKFLHSTDPTHYDDNLFSKE